MAWIPLGGKSRRFKNTETGEEISRRQFQNKEKGISFEAKAKANKEENLAASVARPARGRTKAQTQAEIEQRLENAALQEENKRVNKIGKAASAANKRIKVKKIRPQLLTGGHRAERIPFSDYDQYADLMEQAQTVQAPTGGRLIVAYGFGISGFDERTGNKMDATLVRLQSPRVVMDEDEFNEIVDDYIYEHPYFILSYYWLHLQFNLNYVEKRGKDARKKASPMKRGKRK